MKLRFQFKRNKQNKYKDKIYNKVVVDKCYREKKYGIKYLHIWQGLEPIMTEQSQIKLMINQGALDFYGDKNKQG